MPGAASATLQPASETLVYASILRRALATLLDLFPLLALLWFFGARAASRSGGWTPDGSYVVEPLALLSAIFKAALAWLVYFVCCEWWPGRTLGKWAAGIRVTSLDGSRPNLLQSVARNLLRLVDGIVAYLVAVVFVAVTKKRQRLGDLVASTVVTVARPAPVARLLTLVAAVALPFAVFGATWYSGLLRDASNRWMSSAGTTRLHGEGSYEVGVEAKVDFGKGRGAVRAVNERRGSGTMVNDALIMDAVRFARGANGPERPQGVFSPGDSLGLTFHLTGIGVSDGSSPGRIRTKVRVLDGGEHDAVQPVEQDDQVAASSGRVVSRHLDIALPASCRPGGYHLAITIEDVPTGRRVEATLPFTVAR